MFPAVKRDLAFLVGKSVEFSAVQETMAKVSKLVRAVELFDVYEGQGIPETQKSLAVHVSLRAEDKTLTGAEADAELQKVRGVLQKEFHATMRS